MDGRNDRIDRRTIYGVTIKGTGTDYPTYEATVNEINRLKESLRSKCVECISDPVFEYDSKHRIHAHFTIRSRSISYTRLKRVGWHHDFKRLATSEDLKRWINYLSKHPLSFPECQQYDAELYYARTNGFLE